MSETGFSEDARKPVRKSIRLQRAIRKTYKNRHQIAKRLEEKYADIVVSHDETKEILSYDV